MDKYIYQMFILGCENLNNALKKGLGGVIFFTKDIKSKEQTQKFINNIKQTALIPPFISIDQEGGRVERTENIYPKKLSPKEAFKLGENYLQNQAELLSKEIFELGFNLNFAPCIDVNTNPLNPIIGERAFADNPQDVIKGMEIFINTSKKYGIIPCVKHYPGHGDASADSHLTLPEINLPLEVMKEIHIKPFEYAIKQNINMIMVAHLHCKCFDDERIPTSLSVNALKYLRENLNYQGVIISDDMVMNGVTGYDKLEACIKGIEAGINMFIYRNSDEETLNMIEELIRYVEKKSYLKEKVENSYNKIINLKKQIID